MSAIIRQPLGAYITVTTEDDTKKTFQFSKGDVVTGLKCASYPNAVLSGTILAIGSVRNDVTNFSGSSFGGVPVRGHVEDPCPLTMEAEDIIRPVSITLKSDVECVCGCKIEVGQYLYISLNEIEDIESITNNTVIVTPDDDLAAAVTAAKEGNRIMLLPGEYTADLTVTEGIEISGYGNGCTTITGNVTVSAAGKCVTLYDLAIKNDAVAKKGLVTVTDDSTLRVEQCVLTLENAAGITYCSVVKRDVTAAAINTKISIIDSVLTIKGSDPADVNHGVVLGGYGDTDLGSATVNIENTHIVSNGSGVHSLARGSINVNVRDSKITSWVPLYVQSTGQSTTLGKFEPNFVGSNVTVMDSYLTSVQRRLAGASEDDFTFAAILIQSSQKLKANILGVSLQLINELEGAPKDAEFEPMHAIAIPGDESAPSENCLIRVRGTDICMQNPSVNAFCCEGKTNGLDINDSVCLTATGSHGEVCSLPIRF